MTTQVILLISHHLFIHFCVSCLVITEFWENWYVIGENDAGSPEFKFVYYNGKTRQNTYEGAFIYSRTEELSPTSMKKVYQIAQDAGIAFDGRFKGASAGVGVVGVVSTTGTTGAFGARDLARRRVKR